jgi:hypothetical protein
VHTVVAAATVAKISKRSYIFDLANLDHDFKIYQKLFRFFT